MSARCAGRGPAFCREPVGVPQFWHVQTRPARRPTLRLILLTRALSRRTWRAVIPSTADKVRQAPGALSRPPHHRLLADCGGLLVEPPVFAAIAVEDAVDHHRRIFDVGLPAGRRSLIGDNRPGDILGELALDRQQYLLAARGVALDRLLLDHFVDFDVAITVPIKARPTTEKQIERR